MLAGTDAVCSTRTLRLPPPSPPPSSSPPSVNPPLFVPTLLTRFSTMSRFPTVSFNLYPHRRFLSPSSLCSSSSLLRSCVDQNPGEFSSFSQKSLSPFSNVSYRDPPVFLFKDFPPFLDVPLLLLVIISRFFPSSVLLCLEVSFFPRSPLPLGTSSLSPTVETRAREMCIHSF